MIGVVIFAVFLGLATLTLLKDEPEQGRRVISGIEALQALVMRLVRLVMKLTPYGVMALMTKVIAGSNLQDVLSLGGFLLASYLAIAIMFVIHGLLLTLVVLTPNVSLLRCGRYWPLPLLAVPVPPPSL